MNVRRPSVAAAFDGRGEVSPFVNLTMLIIVESE